MSTYNNDKMIVVTNIEISETVDDFVKFFNNKGFKDEIRDINLFNITTKEIKEELVRGMTFVNHYGKKIKLALPLNIQKKLGIVFQDIENNRNKLKKIIVENNNLKENIKILEHENTVLSMNNKHNNKKINQFKNMSFINRFFYFITKEF